MPISESHTNTATIGSTEYSLTNNSTTLGAVTTDCSGVFFIDLSNLATGDEYRIRVYEKVVSAGSQRVIYDSWRSGVQDVPFQYNVGLLMHGWEITVQKIAGTDRSFSWSIRQAS